MSPNERVVLGSRGSELALTQARMVEQLLREAWPSLAVETRVIRTSGDEKAGSVMTDPRAGRKGQFTGEIERELRARTIDIAVHSAKDLPSEMAVGLEVAAALERAKTDDVLVSKSEGGLAALKENEIVATGSVRRQHQLRRMRPDLCMVDLRGNVPTRLRKLQAAADWQAIVLARAGLDRLGYEFSEGFLLFEGARFWVEFLDGADFLPAGGQGIIALQIRTDDLDTARLVAAVNHQPTLLCLRAEREFLRLLAGDCDSPVGVQARLGGGQLTMLAQVFELDSTEPRVGNVVGDASNPEQLAAQLLDQLR
jgi:hydroxymethylbilane synthase